MKSTKKKVQESSALKIMMLIKKTTQRQTWVQDTLGKMMIYKCSQYEQFKKTIIGYNEYRDTRLQLPIKYNILQYKKAKDKGEFIEEKIVPIKEEDIRTGTCRRIYRFRGGGCREVNRLHDKSTKE